MNASSSSPARRRAMRALVAASATALLLTGCGPREPLSTGLRGVPLDRVYGTVTAPDDAATTGSPDETATTGSPDDAAGTQASDGASQTEEAP